MYEHLTLGMSAYSVRLNILHTDVDQLNEVELNTKPPFNLRELRQYMNFDSKANLS